MTPALPLVYELQAARGPLGSFRGAIDMETSMQGDG